MLKLIPAVATTVVVMGMTIPTLAHGQSDSFKRYLDSMKKEVEADSKGERGQQAIQACSQIHGISIPAQTIGDVARSYGAKKAIEWAECVVDTMYPDPRRR